MPSSAGTCFVALAVTDRSNRSISMALPTAASPAHRGASVTRQETMKPFRKCRGHAHLKSISESPGRLAAAMSLSHTR